MKLVPETRIFTGFLVGIDQDSGALNHEIAKLAPLLLPFLDDIHAMMVRDASELVFLLLHTLIARSVF
jgi:hypothetical protein